MKRVAPMTHLVASSILRRHEPTVRLCGSSGSYKQTNTAVSPKNMLGNSAVIRVVWGVVAMKSLSSCARSNAEDDGIVELRNTGALFVLVTNLKNFNYMSPQQE